MGKRDDKVEGRPYVWMNYREGLDYVNNLARGIKSLNMIYNKLTTWIETHFHVIEIR